MSVNLSHTITHENPETGQQVSFTTNQTGLELVEKMRRTALRFDPTGIVADQRVSLGFMDCHFIETLGGHMFSCDYREIDPPQKSPWESPDPLPHPPS